MYYRAFPCDIMLSAINIHLCKHLFTLLCVTVSPWTSFFVVQAHDDRVRAWCVWLPWISRSVCAIRRHVGGQYDISENTLYMRIVQWASKESYWNFCRTLSHCYIVTSEPEGHFHCSKMFCWEPKGRYHCTKSMVIAFLNVLNVLNGTLLKSINSLLSGSQPMIRSKAKLCDTVLWLGAHFIESCYDSTLPAWQLPWQQLEYCFVIGCDIWRYHSSRVALRATFYEMGVITEFADFTLRHSLNHDAWLLMTTAVQIC